MTDAPVQSKLSKRKIFFGLSAASVAIAAVIAAVGILSGGETWKAVATAGLIFALNILVLISFTAAHGWLKVIQRTASVVAVFGSLFFTWKELPYSWSYGAETAAPHPFLSWLRDWTSATWILVAFFSALSLLSICWKYIRESAALKVVYFIAMGLGIGSAVVFWIAAGTSDYSSENTGLTLLGSALSVLGAAASLIVIIGAFVERGRRKQMPVASVPQSTSSGWENTPLVPSELIRRELSGMAQSGELAQLILSHPTTLNALRAAIVGAPDAQSETVRED